MGQVLLLLVVALTVAAVVFGVTVLVSGRDPGLVPAEPDGRSVPLPGARPLDESDVTDVRFDTALRGYRMAQVDAALRRAAYDIGYKSELIGVLEAENAALREGRTEEADALRRAREEAATTIPEADQSAADPVTIDLSAPGPSAGAHHTGAGAADERTATTSGTGAGAAEAGVAEAPAAAAVEDTTFPAGANDAGPVGATGSAAVEGDRERGPAVRSESA
ncbi:DivIVA domain-containing protein [Micromonospora sp. WMMC241]|uniref:DivIVA domain-containing protein n=1 Tax=Micromonospora sp. WMMC241 TaxID=3015159 RepID=UPI0022B5FE44|nr:DivIVA domain-containing protein [Micromonospora sp. WMMC241]MCZ7439965.1 DivIVA domain-containing protein [Micromonospora sp. WMMC241]